MCNEYNRLYNRLVIHSSALHQHGTTHHLNQGTRLTLAELNWCVFGCQGAGIMGLRESRSRELDEEKFKTGCFKPITGNSLTMMTLYTVTAVMYSSHT